MKTRWYQSSEGLSPQSSDGVSTKNIEVVDECAVLLCMFCCNNLVAWLQGIEFRLKYISMAMVVCNYFTDTVMRKSTKNIFQMKQVEQRNYYRYLQFVLYVNLDNFIVMKIYHFITFVIVNTTLLSRVEVTIVLDDSNIKGNDCYQIMFTESAIMHRPDPKASYSSQVFNHFCLYSFDKSSACAFLYLQNRVPIYSFGSTDSWLVAGFLAVCAQNIRLRSAMVIT